MSPKFWVSTEKIRAWLTGWDDWEAEQPRWFADGSLKFQKRIVKYAPAEALPPTVLRKILVHARHADGSNVELTTDLDTPTLVSLVEQHRHDTSARERARRFANTVNKIRLYVIAIMISYADLVGDVAVALTLLQSDGTQREGYTTMGITIFAQIVQAVISMTSGQGEVAAFAALVGMKPLLHTYNVLSDRPLTPGSKEEHETHFVSTRREEVVLQSLPQGFYQCLVVLRMATRGLAPSWVQWASIAGAATSVAFIVADTERSVDTSKNYRLNYPTAHGYMPDTPGSERRAWLVSCGTFCLIGGTVVLKWLAIATLATASGVVAAGWLMVECLVLLVLRQSIEGSWRFHMWGLDGAFPSLLMHVIIYLGSVAAPFPFLRVAGFLGPALYSPAVCYQVLVSPVMLLVAFSMEGGVELPEAESWALLGVTTATILFGASLMWCFMVPKFRNTFYVKVNSKGRGCGETEPSIPAPRIVTCGLPSDTTAKGPTHF